jgi:hypothetical protein
MILCGTFSKLFERFYMYFAGYTFLSLVIRPRFTKSSTVCFSIAFLTFLSVMYYYYVKLPADWSVYPVLNISLLYSRRMGQPVLHILYQIHIKFCSDFLSIFNKLRVKIWFFSMPGGGGGGMEREGPKVNWTETVFLIF